MPNGLHDVFQYLDDTSVTRRTVSVHLKLTNGSLMSVRVGGPGVACSPATQPFSYYEVAVDHPVPKAWGRYATALKTTFNLVPRLLIADHIFRSGGINSFIQTAGKAAKTDK